MPYRPCIGGSALVMPHRPCIGGSALVMPHHPCIGGSALVMPHHPCIGGSALVIGIVPVYRGFANNRRLAMHSDNNFQRHVDRDHKLLYTQSVSSIAL
jgi:hypothetical protein